jgi:hypothetical protein
MAGISGKLANSNARAHVCHSQAHSVASSFKKHGTIGQVLSLIHTYCACVCVCVCVYTADGWGQVPGVWCILIFTSKTRPILGHAQPPTQ